MTTKEIEKLFSWGWTLQTIATKAGVSKQAIWNRLHPEYRRTPMYKTRRLIRYHMLHPQVRYRKLK